MRLHNCSILTLVNYFYKNGSLTDNILIVRRFSESFQLALKAIALKKEISM